METSDVGILSSNVGVMITIFIFVILIVYTIEILFILSSIKLIDKLEIKNKSNITSKVFCWIQLLPIISYIGLFLYCKNVKEQYETFLEENPEKAIHRFKPEYGYILIITVMLSLITYGNEVISNLFSLTSFVMFIVMWFNIVKTKNSI